MYFVYYMDKISSAHEEKKSYVSTSSLYEFIREALRKQMPWNHAITDAWLVNTSVPSGTIKQEVVLHIPEGYMILSEL